MSLPIQALAEDWGDLMPPDVLERLARKCGILPTMLPQGKGFAYGLAELALAAPNRLTAVTGPDRVLIQALAARAAYLPKSPAAAALEALAARPLAPKCPALAPNLEGRGPFDLPRWSLNRGTGGALVVRTQVGVRGNAAQLELAALLQALDPRKGGKVEMLQSGELSKRGAAQLRPLMVGTTTFRVQRLDWWLNTLGRFGLMARVSPRIVALTPDGQALADLTPIQALAELVDRFSQERNPLYVHLRYLGAATLRTLSTESWTHLADFIEHVTAHELVLDPPRKSRSPELALSELLTPLIFPYWLLGVVDLAFVSNLSVLCLYGYPIPPWREFARIGCLRLTSLGEELLDPVARARLRAAERAPDVGATLDALASLLLG